MGQAIIVATPDALQRARLARLVDADPAFRVVARTSDLMTTYAEVEDRQPRAVLIADTLTESPEFEVMHALFATLDIRWLVVKDSLSSQRRSATPTSHRSGAADLFAVAADAPETEILRQLASLTHSRSAGLPSAKPPVDRAVAGRVPHRGAMAGRATSHDGLRDVTARSDSAPATRRIGLASTMTETRTILIGASTGGVDALLTVLSSFPADCPPTLIVQHTGTGFGESLVALLNRQCKARVELATGSRAMQPGVITVGAGIRNHLVIEDCTAQVCGLKGDAPVSGHLPSVDVLFQSAVPMARRITAALLTGMGRDGADGLLALHRAGATTLAQDEESSIVWGMPRVAIEAGAAKRVLSLDQIGPALLQSCAPRIGADTTMAARPTTKEMPR